MTFQIIANGTPYEFWETARVGRSIDNSTGTFSFTTSDLPDTPIKRGDPVSITINGETKIFGYADDITASGDAESHILTISGRDNACDLIDSSVPDGSKEIEEQITLKALCEKVISDLGLSIKVVDLTDTPNIFTDGDLQAAESGDPCMSYLQSYSRKKQVFLVPSGDGALWLFKPGLIQATTDLTHQKNGTQNNIKSFSVKRSQTNRFNKYICRSQDNIGFSDTADYGVDGTNRNGLVTDTSIRAGRYLEILAEESMDDKECLARAKEEANVRRARSTEYTCIVAGTTQQSGVVWDIGMRVNVNDEIAKVNGIFIIRSVEYSRSIQNGTTTKIVCAPLDAYTVQAVQSTAYTRKSDDNSYTRETPNQPSRSR